MTAQSVQALEQRRRRLVSVNVILLWVVPFLILLAAADLVLWGMQSRKPILPLTPGLEEIQKPLAEIPPLTVEAALFQPAQPAKPALVPKTAVPEVGSGQVQWKLKGVLKGAAMRALMEDASGQTVWVTQDEQLGSFKVKEIKDRSVLLEGDDKSYEIRM